MKKVNNSAEDCIKEYNRLAKTQLSFEKHMQWLILIKPYSMVSYAKILKKTALTYKNLACVYPNCQSIRIFFKSVDLKTNGTQKMKS